LCYIIIQIWSHKYFNQASIIEQKSESIFYEKPVRDVIVFQEDKKRFYCVKNLSNSVEKLGNAKASKRLSRQSTNPMCRLCEKSNPKVVDTKVIEKFVRNESLRKTKLYVPAKISTMSNNTSQNSSRRGTLSTNVSMETNVGESKNIDKIDVNATRRSSEPVSATSSTKSVEPHPLRDSKTGSGNIGGISIHRFTT
jgi:hypothetical protein